MTNVTFVAVFTKKVLFPVGGESLFSLFCGVLRNRFPDAECRLLVPAASASLAQRAAAEQLRVETTALSGLPLIDDLGRHVREIGNGAVVLVDLARPTIDLGRLDALIGELSEGSAAVAFSPACDAIVVSAALWQQTEDLLTRYLSQPPPSIDGLRKSLMVLGGMLPEKGVILSVPLLPDGVDPQENMATVLDAFAIGPPAGLARFVRLLFRLRGRWPAFEDFVSAVVVERVADTWDILGHAGRMDEFHKLEDDHTLDSYVASGREDIERLILGREDVMQGRDPRTLRLLEVGCGNGRLLYALAETFGEAYGVDVVEDHVAEALFTCRAFANVHAARCNGFDLAPFENDFFDITFSFGVLQHAPPAGDHRQLPARDEPHPEAGRALPDAPPRPRRRRAAASPAGARRLPRHPLRLAGVAAGTERDDRGRRARREDRRRRPGGRGHGRVDSHRPGVLGDRPQAVNIRTPPRKAP